MPLGVPSHNPVGGTSTVNRSGNRQRTSGAPSGSTTPRAFTPTPEYSNVGAWSGWDQAAPQRTQDLPTGILGESFNALTGGAVDLRETNRDYYSRKYSPQLVQQAMQSGLDPDTFFALGPAAQQQAVQWGTNLPNSQDIIGQQRQQFGAQQQQASQRSSLLDQFDSLSNLNSLNLQTQFQQGSAMAQARHDMNVDHATTNVYNDLGVLGQQRFRAVDLARDDNRAALLHNSNMRGVLDTSRGLVGQDFSRQQGFLNDQIGFLNERQRLAYDQFQSTDQFAGQQARDLMAQYGFAGRQFAQTQEEAFANRDTQRRAATSDAAARGAFGSAGFGDNIQDIHGQYSRNMDANTLQLDRTTQSIDERDREIGQQRKDLRIGYAGQQVGFRQDARGINNAHDINRISTEGQYNQLRGQYSANDLQRANLQNVDKGLSSLAKEYGLREQDIKNQFEQGLDRMGLDLNDTQQKLGQMLASGNAQLIAQANQFMSQMMAYQ
jgi:hypothetical protein